MRYEADQSVGKEEFGKIRPYLISGNYLGIRTLEREICTVRFKTQPDLGAACSKFCTHYSFLLMCIPENFA